MPVEALERRLAAIVSADVVAYSRLMAEDEPATVARITAYREQVELLVREHRGRVVDFTGDNFLAELASATDGVRCAMEIQRVLALRNEGLEAERRMEFRIGIHLGEVRVEGARIYGAGVNVAARLQALAEHGGICISGAVHDLVRRVPGLEFQDLGVRPLKNIPDPVRVFRVRRSDAARPGTAAAPDGREPSVAVLPFVNMSPDPDQEYFADGMAEELINALTQVPGLRVIARTSAFSFKGTKADIATIGDKLNVSAIVEGSVRKAGGRLRIAAQLIDVAGGHHLWSGAYERPLDDVFQIQDEIARTIVTTIKPKLLGDAPRALVTPPTQSREAYDLYLRAVDRIARFDRGDTRAAIQMLEEATAIDPEYADAWARLALACSQMDFAFEPDPAWHARAQRAVQRAFELDPDNAEAHLAHGRILWGPRSGFQHASALRSVRKALALQPGSHQAQIWRGMILMHIGLLDEAREGLDAALSAQPEDAMTLCALSQAALFQGQVEQSEEYMARAMGADSTLWLNHVFRPMISIYQNDFGRAERSLRTARQLVRDDAMLEASEALLWAKRGEARQAEEALRRATREKPSVAHLHHMSHLAACALAVLGRPSEAIARIREASRTGLPNFSAFRSDPHFQSLRGEPEMASLMSELERECAEYRREFGRA